MFALCPGTHFEKDPEKRNKRQLIIIESYVCLLSASVSAQSLSVKLICPRRCLHIDEHKGFLCTLGGLLIFGEFIHSPLARADMEARTHPPCQHRNIEGLKQHFPNSEMQGATPWRSGILTDIVTKTLFFFTMDTIFKNGAEIYMFLYHRHGGILPWTHSSVCRRVANQ